MGHIVYYIPNEILLEILTRLPVKLLLRFTVVCKSWYSLIRSPKFIRTHLNQAIKNANEQLLTRIYGSNDRKEHYLLLDDEGKLDQEYEELEFPFKSSIGYFRIVGSCNGLVCLCDDYFQDAQDIIVWNPCIRKSVTLRLPEKPPNPYMCVIGFGFEYVLNEYKLVRVMYEKEDLNKCKVPPMVEVYEQGKGVWREVGTAPTLYCMVEFMWSQVFLNRAVHWIAYDLSFENGTHSLIVVFDMENDIFREIELPPDISGHCPTCLSMTLLKESLTVLASGLPGTGACTVCEMREYGVTKSWTKLYHINLPNVLSRTLGFRRNDEILFASDTGMLMTYDLGTNTISNTGIRGSSYSLKVQSFIGSLVLLEGENVLPDWLADFSDDNGMVV